MIAALFTMAGATALATIALYMSIQSSMARLDQSRTTQTRNSPMTARPGAYRNRLGED